MDHPACHVVYVNRSVGEECLVRARPDHTSELGDSASLTSKDNRVRDQVQPLLDAFGDGAFLSPSLPLSDTAK